MQLVYGVILTPEQVTHFRSVGIEVDANGFFGVKLSRNTAKPIKIELEYSENELDSSYYGAVEEYERDGDIMRVLDEYTPDLMVIR